MDLLSLSSREKIQDAIFKLQKIECSLLGNKDDAWILELFFQAGFHRYSLIEWVISKLEYGMKDKLVPRNSDDEMCKILQKALVEMGLSSENSRDFIKGEAKVDEQLELWCLLINLLWAKNEMTCSSVMETDEGFSSSEGMFAADKKQKILDEEYEVANCCISSIFDSVNLQHLMKEDLYLFAPDIEREIQSKSTEIENISSLEQLRKSAKENSALEFDRVLSSIQVQEPMSVADKADDNAPETEISLLECDLQRACSSVLECYQKSFMDTYSVLKPAILHAKAEEFTDVGPYFQKAKANLSKIKDLNKSLSKLSISSLKLAKITAGLENVSNSLQLKGSQSVSVASLLKGE